MRGSRGPAPFSTFPSALGTGGLGTGLTAKQIEADHVLTVAADTAARGATEAQSARDVAEIVKAQEAVQRAAASFNDALQE
jgi:hypothetical protein